MKYRVVTIALSCDCAHDYRWWPLHYGARPGEVELRTVMDGETIEPRAKPITPASIALAAHAGKYELALPGRTMPVEVRLIEGRLAAFSWTALC